MRKWIGPLAALALLFLAGAAQASYPCGIYARIDKVEFEPSLDKPDRVKVWGDFMVAEPTGRLSDPRRGYMYFEFVKGKEDLCRLEWNDLQEIAGSTKNYIAFGSAFTEGRSDLGTVHKADARDPKPIPYPLNYGMSRLRTDDLRGDNNPVAKLQKFLKDNPANKP
ncbi:MAG TPA: hypothetical protein VKD72_33465 [Gemmataceae bacterium]|nr:hypothetical protein [Gemmataceae bacterium]